MRDRIDAAYRIARYLRGLMMRDQTINKFVEKIRSDDLQSVVFGGMVRDFTLGSSEEFSSDIDIVVLESRRELHRLISKFEPRQNKFGGFRLSIGCQEFDIWAFEDTWAFREGIVHGKNLRDLFATTFFNLDAAFLHLSNWTIETSAAFDKAVAIRTLDYNLQENPNKEGSARRAVEMAVKKHLTMSTRLGDFVVRHYPTKSATDEHRAYIHIIKRHLELGDSRPLRLSFESTRPYKKSRAAAPHYPMYKITKKEDILIGNH